MKIRLGILLVVLSLLMMLSIHEYRQHQQNLQVKQKYLLKVRQQELKPIVKSDFSVYFPILMSDAKKYRLKPMRVVPRHNELSLTLKGEYQHFIHWFQAIQRRVPELKWIQVTMESMPEVGLIYQLKGIYEV